jgi:hypothetical protein
MSNIFKICSSNTCGEKPISEFYFDKNKNNGKGVYFSICKQCSKNKSIEYAKNNPEVIKNIRKKYNSTHKEQILKYSISYDSKEVQKCFYKNNKEKFFKYKKERRKKDPIFKITENIRTRIYSYIKNNSTKSIKYLGCDIDFYKKYLESQFTTDMNWDNYGTYWEIDHIKQLCKFNMENIEEQFKAFNYINTRPLSLIDNRTRPKNKKITS